MSDFAAQSQLIMSMHQQQISTGDASSPSATLNKLLPSAGPLMQRDDSLIHQTTMASQSPIAAASSIVPPELRSSSSCEKVAADLASSGQQRMNSFEQLSDEIFRTAMGHQRIKKDALWKPLLRSFRVYIRRTLRIHLEIK